MSNANGKNENPESTYSTEVLDIFALFRSSTSQQSKAEALEATIQILKGHSVNIQEESAIFLLQEVVVLGNGPLHMALDRAIGACGPLQALSACCTTLHTLCNQDMESPCSLQSSLRTVRKLLLSIAASQEETWVDKEVTLRQATNFTPIAQLKSIVDMAVLFPMQIANACHRQKVVLPVWAVRSRFLSRLLESALSMKSLVPASELTTAYTTLLFPKLVHGGASDEVALAIYQHYTNQKPNDRCFSSDVFDVMKTIKSPREMSILLRSIVRHLLSLPKSSTANTYDELCKHSILPYLKLTCKPILEFNRDYEDAWVPLMILSRSSVIADATADRIMCHAVAQVLASCVSSTTDVDESSDDEEGDGVIITEQNQVLQRQVCNVSFSWSERTFVHKADLQLQRHATTFIVSALQLLPKHDQEVKSRIVATLMTGVGARLESSIANVRRDGMVIAEVIAKRLGQDLHFEELDGNRDDDMVASCELPVTVESVQAPAPAVTKTRRKKLKKPVDPDEEYVSSDEDDTDAESNEISNDDDSVWDDELIPYNLDDDEEDLRPTPRPLYLRDCLLLFRIDEKDEKALSQLETALQEVGPLVRTKPMDLHDLAVPLTKELLRVQDLFNIDNFVGLRMDGMVALAVHEPIPVGDHVINQLFDGECGLTDRLDILHTLERASYELCGTKSFVKEQKTATSGQASAIMEQPPMNKLDMLESRTRRWRSARKETVTIANRFGNVAPQWFYRLVGGFMKSRESPKLWGGANGARLLAHFLIALVTIVECAGMSVGAEILAKDLIEFSWTFRSAEVAEIRSSVLIAIAGSLALLSDDALVSVLNGGSVENMPEFILGRASGDPDETCRRLATTLFKGIKDALRARPASSALLYSE
jgi:Telomere length regulation protein